MDIDGGEANHQDQRLRIYKRRDSWGSTDDRESHYGGISASPNPNDEDTISTITIHGRGPGRRAGHTATAVGNRFIFIFGGSCGSDYCKLSLAIHLSMFGIVETQHVFI